LKSFKGIDGQKKAVALRQYVRQLYFCEGWSKNAIAAKLSVSKGFVVNWTQSRAQDPAQDGRGWPQGRGRVWDARTRQRICTLHAELEADPRAFYSGASAIAQRYRQRYPDSPVPPLRTIGRMLAEAGLTRTPKQRVKGAARHLCYPEYTVYETLGRRVLEADFIGQKYLTGSSAPLHFIGFSFKKTPKLRYFQRVEAQTTGAIVHASQAFFRTFEYPDVMKIDNAQATLGSGSARRCPSRFMAFLFRHRILPVFAVPRRPFSQASIEGNNSVFARKFWNNRRFQSLADVDTQLTWFNEDSIAYTGYDIHRRRRRGAKTDFVPKAYFIRQVHEHTGTGRGFIQVMNEQITLPARYIHYFVLAEWNLVNEQLHILFERKQRARTIKSLDFPVNPNAKFSIK